MVLLLSDEEKKWGKAAGVPGGLSRLFINPKRKNHGHPVWPARGLSVWLIDDRRQQTHLRAGRPRVITQTSLSTVMSTAHSCNAVTACSLSILVALPFCTTYMGWVQSAYLILVQVRPRRVSCSCSGEMVFYTIRIPYSGCYRSSL